MADNYVRTVTTTKAGDVVGRPWLKARSTLSPTRSAGQGLSSTSAAAPQR
ncbi:hypothetical protein ACF06P_38420 [Streptomyces sp. NPDC015684]